MFVIRKEKNEVYSLPVKEIPLDGIKAISSELAQKIVKLLSKSPMSPIGIARALKEHEQKIYPKGYADKHRPEWHRRDHKVK